MATANGLAEKIADAVLERLLVIPAAAFDYIANGPTRMHIPGRNAAAPLILDVVKGDTTLMIRIMDPYGTPLHTFVYGRG